MSGDSTVEIITGSSGTTPTESGASSPPSAEVKSTPGSSHYFPPPMRVPPRVAAQTTRPQPGSPEGKAHAAVLREEKRKHQQIRREIRAALCEPGFEWEQTTRTIRKLIRIMVRKPELYTMAQLLVGQATLAAMRDPDLKTALAKRETALDLAKMLGAYKGEDPADKIQRVMDEERARTDAIPTEALIAGAKVGG